MSLADTYVAVRPDLKRFQPDLDRQLRTVSADKHGERVGQSFTRGIDRGVIGVGKIGVKAVGMLAAGIGVAGTALGAMGLKQAMANEQAQIGFSTMLRSGSKAKAFLDDLKDFAAKTPFEFPDLQVASQSLISIGIDADKVIPIMTSLGNATAGMGTGAEGVRRATVAIQQMNAAGRITGEDLNQLRDAGIPVYDLLAAATGKSTKELAKMAQTGKLGKKELDELMKALETGKGLERFSGMMDKQSKSLSGMFSTFKDVVGQNLAKTIEPLIPLLKDGLGGATTFLEQKLPIVRDWFAKVVEKITLMRDQFSGGKDLLSGSGGFSVLFKAKSELPIVDTLERAAEAVKTFWAQWQLGVGPGGELKTLIGDISTIFQALGGYIWDTISAIAGWFAEAASGKEDISVMGQIFRDLLDAIRGLAGFLADHKGVVVGAAIAYDVLKVSMLLSAGAVKGHTAATKIHTAAVAFSKSTLGTWLGVKALEAWAWIKSAALTVAHTVALGAHLAIMGAVRVATMLWTGVQWLLNAALTANPIALVVVAIGLLVAAVVIAWKKSEGFRDVVGKVWSAIKNFFIEGVRIVVMAFLNFVGAIINGAAAAFGWIPGIGPKLKGAAKWFDTFKRNVNNSLEGMKDKNIKVTTTVSKGVRMVLEEYSSGGGRVTAGGTTKFAEGGPVWGPGTSTSDSIPAWLSRGEHIWTAAEVEAAGGHAAVTALRKSVVRGFAKGGPVEVKVTTTGSGVTALGQDARRLNTMMDVALTKMYQPFLRFLRDSMVQRTGAANVDRWLPTVLRVLSELHQQSKWATAVLRRIQFESGGNPKAINLWDINAKRGYPSQGLMQTIPATFYAYAGPYARLGITNPLANIYAGVNYALHRYGGLSILDTRLHPHGYDLGGILRPGRLGINRTDRPERVLSPEQTALFDRLIARLERGDSDGRPMRLHPDDIRALGAEMRAGMIGSGYEAARTASLYART